MEEKGKKLLKEDINFLEYPNWILDSRTKSTKLLINKASGKYTLNSPEGLPTHFDKIVFYAILYRLHETTQLEGLELRTTRYQIALDIFGKRINQSHRFEQIFISLKKWKKVSIDFEGVFYQDGSRSRRCFGILDDVILNEKTKELYIRFNQQYIRAQKESEFYKYIDFNEYKKLSRAVSARLYELLGKSFKERKVWQINIQNLAEKLTLDKRENCKDYYSSDVLTKLKPAIQEINNKTELNIEFDFDTHTKLCLFRSTTLACDKNPEEILERGTFNPAVADRPLLMKLISLGISKVQSRAISKKYSEEKINHKIELLTKNEKDIKNIGAWLIKALEEDWKITSYNKKAEEQRIKKEQAHKKELEEKQKQRLEELRLAFQKHKEVSVQQIFNSSPKAVRDHFDRQFKEWLTKQNDTTRFPLPEDIYRTNFLLETLWQDDISLEEWVKHQQI